MKELIVKIIVFVAPIIAGFITSIVIPVAIEKTSLKHLKKKIEEVNEAKELQEIKEELKVIKKEILEMRGKIK